MDEQIRHLIHAINYSLFMRLLKFSESRFYKLESSWNDFVFTDKLAINHSAAIASFLEIAESDVHQAYGAVLKSFRDIACDDMLIITIRDEHYPKQLTALKYPPAVLFMRGEPRLLANRTVAVVGTREPSEEGAKRARRAAMELTERGFTVVSGLAKGIDTAAHTATIKADGETIAVIGSPIDVAYPSENFHLQEIISNGHLLVSQFVLGQQVRPWNFPQRNNTMVGLSEATIIVEAKVEGGGAKIQGELCLKAGRKLFIMKSFVSDRVPWIHDFIRQGAIVFDNIDIVVDELERVRPDTQESKHHHSQGFAFSAVIEEF